MNYPSRMVIVSFRCALSIINGFIWSREGLVIVFNRSLFICALFSSEVVNLFFQENSHMGFSCFASCRMQQLVKEKNTSECFLNESRVTLSCSFQKRKQVYFQCMFYLITRCSELYRQCYESSSNSLLFHRVMHLSWRLSFFRQACLGIPSPQK